MGEAMGDLGGQRLHFNDHRRVARAVDQLIGMCAGIVADGQINEREVAFLSTWLAENSAVREMFPGNHLAAMLSEISAAGAMTEDHRQALMRTLQEISGNHFADTGAAVADSPAVTPDRIATVEFAGKRFCFTGTFVIRPRAVCEALLAGLGAECERDVTRKTDYLVIGGEVSADWKHETFGRKIEKALELRERTGRPIFLSEQDLIAAIQ